MHGLRLQGPVLLEDCRSKDCSSDSNSNKRMVYSSDTYLEIVGFL